MSTLATRVAERLREMDKAATVGPWFVVGLPWNDGLPWVNATSADPHRFMPVCDMDLRLDYESDRESDVAGASCADDCATIVAMRNAMPAFVELVQLGDIVIKDNDDMARYDRALSALAKALGVEEEA